MFLSPGCFISGISECRLFLFSEKVHDGSTAAVKELQGMTSWPAPLNLMMLTGSSSPLPPS